MVPLSGTGVRRTWTSTVFSLLFTPVGRYAVMAFIAIVVLSGNPNPDLIKRTIEENASDYLVKGVGDLTGEGLAASIRTAIKSNAAICEIKSMKEPT